MSRMRWAVLLVGFAVGHIVGLKVTARIDPLIGVGINVVVAGMAAVAFVLAYAEWRRMRGDR